GKNSLNRLIRCVCGKKIGPDPRNFNQRVSLGRHDLLIRTFPNSSDSSVGSWGDSIGYGIPSFNKAKNPPRFIHFCWDSVIDKRVYETTITFGSKVWEMMLIPYFAPYDEIQTAYHNGAKGEQRYHRFMVIGLAPEGKVRIWLQNSRKPNIELTDILVETVSGDKLDMCKNITDFSRGYKYSKGTEDFIKGKKYPYGEW
ncbi:DUF2931 family protein, partial [Enterobacter hormaechei]